MAAAIQKNGIKSRSNGNGLVNDVTQVPNITEYTQVNKCTSIADFKEDDQHFNEDNEDFKDEDFRDDDDEDFKIDEDFKEEDEDFKIEEEELKKENDELKDKDSDEPEIDIVINNVVCSFSVSCHLNLREIALHGTNVEYRKENGMITMKIRRPYTTASIWSSGKVTCTGATSEIQAKVAARRFARCLQKLGFSVRFNNYRVVNVLGTCSMPFAIRINSFSERHKEAEYEPELHPGVTYKLKSPKATLKIFSTGSVTVTAPSVADVQAAIEYIYPLIYEFRKERTQEENDAIALKKMAHAQEQQQNNMTLDFE